MEGRVPCKPGGRAGRSVGLRRRWPIGVVLTSSNQTRPVVNSSPRTSHASVASAGISAMKRIGFQSKLPKTLFFCCQFWPDGAMLCSMHSIPLYGLGGRATSSARTMASTRTRLPLTCSNGNLARTVRLPSFCVDGCSMNRHSEPEGSRVRLTPGRSMACQTRLPSAVSKSSWKTASSARAVTRRWTATANTITIKTRPNRPHLISSSLHRCCMSAWPLEIGSRRGGTNPATVAHCLPPMPVEQVRPPRITHRLKVSTDGGLATATRIK